MSKEWCYCNSIHYKVLKMSEQACREIDNTFILWEDHLISSTSVQKDVFDKEQQYVCFDESYQGRKENILRCFLSAFYPDICTYNGNPQIGYYQLQKQMVLQVYGSSTLQILNIYPKWIIGCDLYLSERGYQYCRVAQEISFDLIIKHVPSQYLNQYKIHELEHIDGPIYKIIEIPNLPTYYMNKIVSKFKMKRKFNIKYTQ